MVDQSPIGKSALQPGELRRRLGRDPQAVRQPDEAKERGYTPGTFSFNSGTGRCPTCTGSGFEHVEMQFLSDVYLRCPDCDGKRYRPEILALELARQERRRRARDDRLRRRFDFFADQKAAVLAALAPLADVGLEYLRLGQPVPTLSGGEAQRLKLAGHLAEAAEAWRTATSWETKLGDAADAAGLLFLFDEPTTGLHFEDVAALLAAFENCSTPAIRWWSSSTTSTSSPPPTGCRPRPRRRRRRLDDRRRRAGRDDRHAGARTPAGRWPTTPPRLATPAGAAPAVADRRRATRARPTTRSPSATPATTT